MLNAIAAESNAVVKAASLVPSGEKNNLNMQALIQLRVFFDLLMAYLHNPSMSFLRCCVKRLG